MTNTNIDPWHLADDGLIRDENALEVRGSEIFERLQSLETLRVALMELASFGPDQFASREFLASWARAGTALSRHEHKS